MDPSAYAALFPRERFERFVVAKSSAEEEEATTTTTTGGLRLRPGADGRPLGRARRVKIGFAELAHVEDDCGASVMCHLKGFDGKKGKKTTVVCASRMERTGTNPRCPEEGFVEVNVEIASCSHAENSASQRGQTRQRRDDWESVERNGVFVEGRRINRSKMFARCSTGRRRRRRRRR